MILYRDYTSMNLGLQRKALGVGVVPGAEPRQSGLCQAKEELGRPLAFRLQILLLSLQGSSLWQLSPAFQGRLLHQEKPEVALQDRSSPCSRDLLCELLPAPFSSPEIPMPPHWLEGKKLQGLGAFLGRAALPPPKFVGERQQEHHRWEELGSAGLCLSIQHWLPTVCPAWSSSLLRQSLALGSPGWKCCWLQWENTTSNCMTELHILGFFGAKLKGFPALVVFTELWKDRKRLCHSVKCCVSQRNSLSST